MKMKRYFSIPNKNEQLRQVGNRSVLSQLEQSSFETGAKNILYLGIMVLVLIFMTTRVHIFANTDDKSSLIEKYNSLQDHFSETLKSIKTKDDYDKLMIEHKQGLTTLMEKIETLEVTDELKLIKGKISFDLDNNSEALKIFNELNQDKKSPLAKKASFEIVRVLIKQNKYDEALPLFKQVEEDVKQDRNYNWILLEFAFSARDIKDREQFSHKFIQSVGDSIEFERYRTMMFDNLARIALEKGDKNKSISILEKALKQAKSDKAKKILKSSLKQFRLLGNPAPEINIENWINSDVLTLNRLKGKFVIIDFWATWCKPCRNVIPLLTQMYDQFKEKGLVIIGLTRFYGSYSDEMGSKGKVAPEEEIKLIEEFSKRQKINYPIAIAKKRDNADMYGITGIPTLVMIDKEGKIVKIEIGSDDLKTLEKKITGFLNN